MCDVVKHWFVPIYNSYMYVEFMIVPTDWNSHSQINKWTLYYIGYMQIDVTYLFRVVNYGYSSMNVVSYHSLPHSSQLVSLKNTICL